MAETSQNKKRVTIYLKNPSHHHHHQEFGKVFHVPDTMDQLIEMIRNKFNLNNPENPNLNNENPEEVQICSTEKKNPESPSPSPPQLKLFTKKGGEIDDIDLIRDDECLYVSSLSSIDDAEMTPQNNQQCSCYTNHDRNSYCSLYTPFIHQSITPINNNKVIKTRLNDEWIKLNIGGKIFTTTRSTIMAKEPNSMLAKMFECWSRPTTTAAATDMSIGGNTNNADCDEDNKHIEPPPLSLSSSTTISKSCNLVPSVVDDQGAYLIDRSPEYFQPLIGYLRHGNLIIDKYLNPMGVLEEAKFYGFYSLIPELEATILQESLLQNTLERSIGLTPLTRKDVVKAIIHTSKETRLRFQGVNLSGADLSRLDLSNINFKYAILCGANLQGATLNNCCLERADLSKCNLEGASLINCYMVCCNLEGSNLRAANMDSSTYTELTNLEGANLNNVNLEGSKMHRVNLRLASLKNANVQNCNLDFACLAGANLENCDLSGSDLNEVNLRGANLKGTRFDLIHTPLHMFYLTHIS